MSKVNAIFTIEIRKNHCSRNRNGKEQVWIFSMIGCKSSRIWKAPVLSRKRKKPLGLFSLWMTKTTTVLIGLTLTTFPLALTAFYLWLMSSLYCLCFLQREMFSLAFMSYFHWHFPAFERLPINLSTTHWIRPPDWFYLLSPLLLDDIHLITSSIVYREVVVVVYYI